MMRLKMGLAFVGILGIMGMSANAAFAEYTSTNGTTTGSFEVITPGVFTYESGVTVECPAKSISAQWKLLAKKAPGQQIEIKWGTECFTVVFGVKVAATISPSEFQVNSPETGKETYELKGSALNETVIKAAQCVVKVPTASNGELGTITQKTLGENELAKISIVEKISAKAKEKGLLCNIKANETHTASLTGVEAKAIGQTQS